MTWEFFAALRLGFFDQLPDGFNDAGLYFTIQPGELLLGRA